jgi:cysteinyl-tRNA synthetase
MGHARTYVSLDFIRRILADYFRIPVTWRMNITDVDDKIIHAFNEGKTGFATPFEYSRDREKAFFYDMDRLNVRRPDSLLRVTEVIPEIVDFIRGLVDKGAAYAVDGSVYFDLIHYTDEMGFRYPELEPESASEDNRQSSDCAELKKRNSADFALWKAAKPGEPSWDSPWGQGRPGWHIECSTMSTVFFGNHFDVHCGGIDLRFPHHANEIAQSQALSGIRPWIRTWLHTGQLRINGEKMAKSLGNFQTISQALETNPWRVLRMAFAMLNWQHVMELSKDLLDSAAATLSRITNFLDSAEAVLSSGKTTDTIGFSGVDSEFCVLISKTQDDVRAAFANNFNVPAAIEAIRTLIGGAYTPVPPNNALLVSAARYVSEIMTVLGFGLDTVQLASASTTGLGDFGVIMAEYRKGARADGRALFKDLQTLSTIMAIRVKGPRPQEQDEQKKYDALKDVVEHKRVLDGLDELRDVKLPSLGIRLEDQQGGSVAFKLGNPEDVTARLKASKQPAAEPAQAPAPVVHVEMENPEGMYLKMMDQYSKFDDQGIPTHGADGQVLPKSKQKRLKKEYEKLLRQYQKQASGK